MSCLYVYCPTCKAEKPYRKPPYCKDCGSRLEVEFDEYLDHHEEESEDDEDEYD